MNSKLSDNLDRLKSSLYSPLRATDDLLYYRNQALSVEPAVSGVHCNHFKNKKFDVIFGGTYA